MESEDFAGLIERLPQDMVSRILSRLDSRVVGAFEGSIAQLAALAALMPIVASIGGNTGNQTAALVIRGLALAQLDGRNLQFLLRKELSIGLMNGTLWGAPVRCCCAAPCP